MFILKFPLILLGATKERLVRKKQAIISHPILKPAVKLFSLPCLSLSSLTCLNSYNQKFNIEWNLVALHTVSLDLEAFEGVVLAGARLAEKH
jgi:hypothetical protein